MKLVKTKDMRSFCELVYNSWCDGLDECKDPIDFEGINIVAKYDMIIKVINGLIRNTPFSLFGGSVWDEDYNLYNMEYILSINSNKEIWVEPAYNVEKDKYLYAGDCLTFVHGDCNSKYLSANKDTVFVEFDIDNVDDKVECKKCECKSKDDNVKVKVVNDDCGDVKGFTQSFTSDNGYYSRSFYSDDEDILKQVLELWT